MNELFLHIGFVGTLLAPLCCVLLLCLKALLKRPMKETEISVIARVTSFAYLTFTTILLVSWLLAGQSSVMWDIGSIYHLGDSTIEIALFLDRAGVVFLAVTAITANIIILFSRRYLHRRH